MSQGCPAPGQSPCLPLQLGLPRSQACGSPALSSKPQTSSSHVSPMTPSSASRTSILKPGDYARSTQIIPDNPLPEVQLTDKLSSSFSFPAQPNMYTASRDEDTDAFGVLGSGQWLSTACSQRPAWNVSHWERTQGQWRGTFEHCPHTAQLSHCRREKGQRDSSIKCLLLGVAVACTGLSVPKGRVQITERGWEVTV